MIKKNTEAKPKVHTSLIEAVIMALGEIFLQNRKADKVLAEVLRSNKKWGSRDRAFIAESTYEIVRYWRLMHHIIELDFKFTSATKIKKVVGAYLVLQGANVFDLYDWKALSFNYLKTRYEEAKQSRKVFQSIPDWLDELGEKQLGNEKWSAELLAMNHQAPVCLRVNTLKNTKQELRSLLLREQIETEEVPGVDHAIYLKKRQNVFISDAFKEGRFEVQDAGSQLIGSFLNVQPGMRVVDACAGAGGKALHLASLMENKGQIIALDVEQWKLDELKKRARRDGVHNVETRLIEGKTIKRLYDSADRVLLDVPCSGLGTLRRNPDAKWKLKAEFIQEIQVVQQDILSRYSRILKVGGKLVYATCSVLPSECEDQVKQFLAANENFSLEAERKTSPAIEGFDGFYMALIHRNS